MQPDAREGLGEGRVARERAARERTRPPGGHADGGARQDASPGVAGCDGAVPDERWAARGDRRGRRPSGGASGARTIERCPSPADEEHPGLGARRGPGRPGVRRSRCPRVASRARRPAPTAKRTRRASSPVSSRSGVAAGDSFAPARTRQVARPGSTSRSSTLPCGPSACADQIPGIQCGGGCDPPSASHGVPAVDAPAASGRAP